MSQSAPPDQRAAKPVIDYALIRMIAALAVMTIGASGMFSVMVVLKPVAAEFGASRGAGSIPYALTMVGFGLGGIMMGRITDLYGLLRPVMFAAVALGGGFILASMAEALWQFVLIQCVLVGFLGCSVTFAPMIADTSLWFNRRRGIAVAIVISGSYLGGTIWPPVVQFFVDSNGWRATYFGLGVFCLLSLLPLALIFKRQPPKQETASAQSQSGEQTRPLNMPPNMLLGCLCVAGIGCCTAMAMPQVHIVAYATDLGYAAARGAEMLSLMLGFGIVSRLISGWISDHIGGLKTLILGSALQSLMLVLFIPFNSLWALYILSALFGLSQGGIVPSYAIIIRRFFPPNEAGWRIGAVMFATMLGMALGGWMAGLLYDLTGSYDAAFLNALAFNLLNLAMAYLLLRRRNIGPMQMSLGRAVPPG